jgi:CheY-like chemotaxis protein
MRLPEPGTTASGVFVTLCCARPGTRVESWRVLPSLPAAALVYHGGPVPERENAAPPTAVVVEDDDGIRELLAEVLSENGYHVSAYESVETALDALGAMVPTLVVTDLMFDNGRDGWALARALRADPRTARVPLLLCSAMLPTRAAREDASSLRAAWVSKPFAIHTLLTNVELAASLAERQPDGGERP